MLRELANCSIVCHLFINIFGDIISICLEKPSVKQKQKKDDTISDSTGNTATVLR